MKRMNVKKIKPRVYFATGDGYKITVFEISGHRDQIDDESCSPIFAALIYG